MATADQSTTRVAQAVVGDLDQAREKAAQELFPKGGPGAGVTTQAAMVAHVRALWPYPEMRAALFQRVVPTTPNPFAKEPDGSDAVIPARNGLKNWENLRAAAFPLGYPEPLPPMPMMGAQGGFAPEGY